MLDRGDGLQVAGIVALEPADELHREPAREVGILAVRLLPASPARVAKQIDVGRPDGQALIALVLALPEVRVMLVEYLVGQNGRQANVETVVPRSGEADGLRKHGREPRARDAVQALVPPVVLGNPEALDGGRPIHHLRHLLLERHAADEIRRAPLECLSRSARGDCGCEQDGEAEQTARHRFLRGGIALPANERQNDLMTIFSRPLALLLSAYGLVPCGAAAQAAQPDPWAGPLRGTWVRMGPAAPGDVLLASGSSGAEIVVGAAENLNVRQAATFLAGDIEAISGYRPPIVSAPTAGKTSIRLVTAGDGPLPRAIALATAP